MNILNKIISHKKQELNVLTRNFKKAILQPKVGKIALIAEVKLKSPSSGQLGGNFSIEKQVQDYEQGGADAISVVVDEEFFGGKMEMVRKAKNLTNLPVLCKEFIIDPIQVYAAKYFGADALLLIAKIVTPALLIKLVNLAEDLGLEPVVEVNNPAELKSALATSAFFIAVNARNLDNFAIDLKQAARLAKLIPSDRGFLGFSGVRSRKDILEFQKAGAKAVLVGTSLMKSADPANLIRRLKGEVLVKICGIRSIQAAQVAVDNGVDFLGLNFVPTSKRLIDLSLAKQISRLFKAKVKLVGVFKDQPIDTVNKIIKECNLDYAQLHGNETPDYVKQVEAKVIKAISLENLNARLRADFYLLDRLTQGRGEMVDLKKAASLAKDIPLIFAGGLTPGNVRAIIDEISPLGVDVASGVETNGTQDLKKIKEFIFSAKKD